jgi:hypothetical protein
VIQDPKLELRINHWQARETFEVLLAAQERLGHSTITITLDIYSHVTDTMQLKPRPISTMHFRLALKGPAVAE